jgi:hypothetical protein
MFAGVGKRLFFQLSNVSLELRSQRYACFQNDHLLDVTLSMDGSHFSNCASGDLKHVELDSYFMRKR